MKVVWESRLQGQRLLQKFDEKLPVWRVDHHQELRWLVLTTQCSERLHQQNSGNIVLHIAAFCAVVPLSVNHSDEVTLELCHIPAETLLYDNQTDSALFEHRLYVENLTACHSIVYEANAVVEARLQSALREVALVYFTSNEHF
jgi:hypothetical protein